MIIPSITTASDANTRPNNCLGSSFIVLIAFIKTAKVSKVVVNAPSINAIIATFLIISLLDFIFDAYINAPIVEPNTKANNPTVAPKEDQSTLFIIDAIAINSTIVALNAANIIATEAKFFSKGPLILVTLVIRLFIFSIILAKSATNINTVVDISIYLPIDSHDICEIGPFINDARALMTNLKVIIVAINAAAEENL